MSVFFFFFKQKTAYEIVMRLEFRRVLFRSPGGDGDRYDPFGAVTVTAGLLVAVYALSQAPQYGWGSARTISLMVVAAVRSEERRVGKECRARLAPEQEEEKGEKQEGA